MYIRILEMVPVILLFLITDAWDLPFYHHLAHPFHHSDHPFHHSARLFCHSDRRRNLFIYRHSDRSGGICSISVPILGISRLVPRSR